MELVGNSPNTGNAQTDMHDKLIDKLRDDENGGSIKLTDEYRRMDENEVAVLLDDPQATGKKMTIHGLEACPKLNGAYRKCAFIRQRNTPLQCRSAKRIHRGFESREHHPTR